MTFDFFLNGDPGNVSNRGSSGSCLGRGRPAFSDAITLTDEFIACQVKAAGKPTGAGVEVDGVFRDERVDRIEKGEEPVTITRLGRRDARHLITGGMWRDFEKFRIGLPGQVEPLIPDGVVERIVSRHVTLPRWVHPGKLHCFRLTFP